VNIELTEALWLDEREEFSLSQLAELSGLTISEVEQLVDCEALAPAGAPAGEPVFKAQSLVTARIACRLRTDFDLDSGALALVLTLLERIRQLEARLQGLECRLPQR
jgi:hypothetical protein